MLNLEKLEADALNPVKSSSIFSQETEYFPWQQMNKWAERSQGVRDFGPTKGTQDVEGQRPMALTLAP